MANIKLCDVCGERVVPSTRSSNIPVCENYYFFTKSRLSEVEDMCENCRKQLHDKLVEAANTFVYESEKNITKV